MSFMGRPTVYDPAYCDKVLQMAAVGKCVEEIARDIGIACSTYYKFVQEIPDFSEVHAEAKKLRKAWYIQTGRENLNNRNFNPVTWSTLLQNQCRQSTKDRVIKIRGLAKASERSLKENISLVLAHLESEGLTADELGKVLGAIKDVSVVVETDEIRKDIAEIKKESANG